MKGDSYLSIYLGRRGSSLFLFVLRAYVRPPPHLGCCDFLEGPSDACVVLSRNFPCFRYLGVLKGSKGSDHRIHSGPVQAGGSDMHGDSAIGALGSGYQTS